MKTTRRIFRLSAIAPAFLSVLVASPLSAADRMRAGLWEFTMASKGESRTFKQCITAEKAGSVNGDTKSARAFAEKEAAGRCKVTDYKIDGAVVTYSILCGTRTIRSTTTYHGDQSEGDLFTKTEGEPETAQHVRGKRLGDCP